MKVQQFQKESFFIPGHSEGFLRSEKTKNRYPTLFFLKKPDRGNPANITMLEKDGSICMKIRTYAHTLCGMVHIMIDD